MNKNVIIVGISGVTCSGKTTIAKELEKSLENSVIFSQDNYFHSVDHPTHTWIRELNHINWDILSALDMERMTREIQECVKKKKFKIIIVEGFCIFNYKPLADLCDFKYYFTLNYEECFRRRKTRIYEPADVPGYFETCVWPEYLKHFKDVKENCENIRYFTENNNNQSISKVQFDNNKILTEILDALNNK